MKARIKNTKYEVDVVPYFPEGMFAGFTDVSGQLQPGMIVYKPNDLDFIETPPKLKPSVDWDAFRRDAAKNILATLAGKPELYARVKYKCKDAVLDAIALADELVKQLRKEEKDGAEEKHVD